jgi:hypothetical protein
MGTHRRPRPLRRLALALAAVLLIAGGAGGALSGTSPSSAATAAVTVDYLAPAYATAGEPVPGIATVHASGPVTAAAFVIAVRDSHGRNRDFPDAATGVRLTTTAFGYESGRRAFAAGTYTVFPSWKDGAGAWHPLQRAVLTVGRGSVPSTPPPSPGPTQTASGAPSPTPGPTRTAPAPTPGPTASGTQPAAPGPLGVPGTWTSILDSEFTGTALDTSVWRTGWFGPHLTTPVNGPEQDCYDPANVSVSGGSLNLLLTDRASTCNGTDKAMTGAMVSSNPHDGRASGGFEFSGRAAMEARVFLPAAPDGTVANWPSWWTDGQNWPANGEIDLVEGLGGRACFHVHTDAGGPGGCVRGTFTGWHTYGAVWTGAAVAFYYDGAEVGSEPFANGGAPQYLLLLNTQAPGIGGTTSVPAVMKVAYVRVWKPGP